MSNTEEDRLMGLISMSTLAVRATPAKDWGLTIDEQARVVAAYAAQVGSMPKGSPDLQTHLLILGKLGWQGARMAFPEGTAVEELTAGQRAGVGDIILLAKLIGVPPAHVIDAFIRIGVTFPPQAKPDAKEEGEEETSFAFTLGKRDLGGEG